MRPRLSWIPYFILVISLLITGVATHYVAETITTKDRLRFQNVVDGIEDHMQSRLDTYIALLRATRGLFAASEMVSYGDFRKFVAELRLRREYSGVQGIGFSLRVLPGQREAIVERMQAQGLSDFKIWPADERPEVHSILYLEPLDRRNQAAIGYDMYTSEIRREAMAKARDTGVAVMSGKVSLVQEIDEEKQAGFLIYLPVYHGYRVPETLADRRERLIGFVYAPFRAGDLLNQIVSETESKLVRYDVYDGAEINEDALLFASAKPAAEGLEGTNEEPFSTTVYLTVARRTWAVVFESLPAFHSNSDRQLIPLTGAGGMLGSLLLFVVTLSQARAREAAEETAAALRVSRREAEMANRLKDQFLATVSHELRTPLNAITGWTQLLLAEENVDDEIRKALEVIERNARQQGELIEELLDVSRIISGRLRLDLEKVDVTEAIREALQTVRPAADARQISIETMLDSDASRIMADSGRLRQIVWNLVSNAIKFTPPGGRVSVKTRRVDSHVELEVSDTGKGIPPDFLPYVFNAFRQADSTSTRKHGGLGLGLAIVHHLVELHGGTIVAESAGEGRGASFTVTLPVRATIPETPTPMAVAPDFGRGAQSPTEPDGALDGLVALVVDDEQDARELLRRALERRHARVLTAASAKEGLEILERSTPDVIISDIGMPETNGLDFIRRIRARENGDSTPAIAVTAFASRKDSDEALAAGFQRHLAKPVDANELTQLITTLVKPAGEISE